VDLAEAEAALAALYVEAAAEAPLHQPDEDGVCLRCDRHWPCAEGWINTRAASGAAAYRRRVGDG
jgi:hypothetical protein